MLQRRVAAAQLAYETALQLLTAEEREGREDWGPHAREARGGPRGPLSLPSLFSLQIVLIYLVFLRFSFISVTFSTQNVAQTRKRLESECG